MRPSRPARREPPVPGGDKRRPPPQPQPPQSNSLALPPRPKRADTAPQSDDDFDDFDDDEYEEPMEQQQQPPRPPAKNLISYDTPDDVYEDPEETPGPPLPVAATRRHMPLPALPTPRNLQPEPEEYSAIGDEEENVYNEAEEDERPQPIGRPAFPPPGKRGTPLPQLPQPVNNFQEDTYYEPEEEARPPPRIHQSQPRSPPAQDRSKTGQAPVIAIDTMAIRNAQNKLRTAIPAFPEPKKPETTTTSQASDGPISVMDRIKMFNTGKTPAGKTPAPVKPVQPHVTATPQPASSVPKPAPPRVTSPPSKPLPPPINSIPSNISTGPAGPVVSAPPVGNSINQDDGLYQYRWYFSNIDRNVSEDKLRQLGTDGAFMVRKSQGGDSQNPYSLSLWYMKRMWNFRIGIRKNKRFAIGTEQPGEKTFDQVPDLVEYHRKNTLTVTDKNGNEYPVKLGQFPMM